MYPYQGKPGELVFVHIPKTGGSSIKRLAGLNRGNPNIKPFCGALKTDGSGRNGHVAYNEDIEAQYFTILRDPVKRCWSHYHQFKRTYRKRVFRINGKHWDRGWMSLVESNKQFSNFASACITGKYDCEFDEVISALEKYIYVGRFEKFAESYRSICSIIGVEDAGINHSNKKSYKKTVPRHFRNVITEMNQLDIEVYNWCLENIWKG